MPKFIGYTVGLLAHSEEYAAQLLKVEYRREDDGTVTLIPVSGHNLAPIKNLVKNARIAAEEFSNRPDDNIEAARWAFKLLGFSLSGDTANAAD